MRRGDKQKGFTPLEIKRGQERNYKFLTGFTLLEVLIVVLIIGILATLSFPSLKAATIKAKFPEIFIMVRQIEQNIDYHIAEQGGELTAVDMEIFDDFDMPDGTYFYHDIGPAPGPLEYQIHIIRKGDDPEYWLCRRVIAVQVPNVRYWQKNPAHEWSDYLKLPED